MSGDSMETNEDDGQNSEQIPKLHLCFPRVRQPSRKALEAFAEEYDIEILMGMFTEKEDKKIKRNFARFCEQYELTDNQITRCALLGFTVEDEEHVAEYRKAKEYVKNLGFYYWLARGLPNRLISAVYHRARKLLHPFRKQSELTESEKEEIINTAKSMEKCKNMFSKLGYTYDCAPRAVQKIIKTHVDLDKGIEFKKGYWQPKETMKLVQGILELIEIDIDELSEEHLRAELPWVELAKKVEMRSAESCRDHVPAMVANLDSIKREYKLLFNLKKQKRETTVE
ncbi:uncharacterized protein LOC107366868 [Tetranychus urticae]|uniref:Uncharacterized protein n=1 Tax=Tetranychus urticae TaxID=32264 RepID=T1KSI4_TETUR|nr:uncharacterized protein LOC107366868 [Tetranychus urticae]